MTGVDYSDPSKCPFVSGLSEALNWARIKKDRKKLSTNFHKRWVQQVLLATNAYALFDRVYFIMKNLPNYLQSVVSTVFISVVPIFLIYIMNLVIRQNRKEKSASFYYMIAFAIGGLLGDVFLHTLPHMSESQNQ